MSSAIARAAGRSRARVTPRAALLVMLITVIAVLSVMPLRELFEQRSYIDGLERKATALERANEDLRRRIARLQNPVNLERLARECLGMVKPGETAFVVVPEDGQIRPPDCS